APSPERGSLDRRRGRARGHHRRRHADGRPWRGRRRAARRPALRARADERERACRESPGAPRVPARSRQVREEEPMSSGPTLPSIAEVIGPLLLGLPVEQQPLFVAIAERLAAERYRAWAARVDAPERKAGLLACAEREEEIARRVEALYPTASKTQREILDRHPDLIELNRTLFAPFTLEQQFHIQAQGERVGAATWRRFARDG